MVFWGIVVKPGTPFTLSDNRRLHLSQATLGVGSATTKSIVQCNVGDKTPLFLCTLIAEQMECCPLNLKYEEADKVVFSVIGSRPVHLTGYYEENSTNVLNGDVDDKTESYGEDIPENETERSESDDGDEYGGSFINDGDVEVLPTSPAPEVGKRSHRKKRYTVESDNDDLVNDTSKLALPSAEVDETSGKKEGGKLMDGIVELDNDDRSLVTAPKHALPNAEGDETSSKKDDTELMKCHKSKPNKGKCSPVNATPQLFGTFDVSDSEEDDTRPIGSHQRHNRAFKSLSYGSVGIQRVTANSKNNLTEDKSGTLTLSAVNDVAALNPERDAGMKSDLGTEHEEELLKEVISSKSVDNLPQLDPLLVRLKNTVDNGDSLVPKLEIKVNDADAGKSLEGAKEILENLNDVFINDGDVEVLPTSPAPEDGKRSRRKKRRTVESDNDDPVNDTSKLALPSAEVDEKYGKKEVGKLMNGHIVESDNDVRSLVTAPKDALTNAEVDEISSKKDDTKLMKCHKGEPNKGKFSPVNATPQLFGIFDVSDSEEDDTRPIGSHQRHNKAFESLIYGSVGIQRVTANFKNSLTEDKSGTLTLSPVNDLAALKPERDSGMGSDFGIEHEEEPLKELISSKSVNNLPQLDPLLVRLKNTVDNGDSLVPKLEIKTDDADAGKSLKWAKEILENSNNDGAQEKQRKKKKPKAAEDCCKDDINGVDKAVKNGKLDSDDGQEKQRKKRKRKAAEDCCKDDINEVDKALKNGKLDSDVDAGRESDFGSKHEEEQQRELISSKSVDNLPQLDPLLVQLKNTVDNRDSPAPKLEMKTDDADAGESLEGAKESLENSNDDGQVKERKKKKRKTAEDCCKDDMNEVDKALKNGKLDSDEVFLVNEDKSCLKSQQKERKRKKKNDSNIKDVDKSKTSANELVIEEQEIGNPDGKIATMGKRVTVHYVVKSLESEQVLSNLDQSPMKFKLGAKGRNGWELGIEGMRVGGKRRIRVPPSLGSSLSVEGASGDALSVYEVELVDVR